jgi:hypothetical protein
VRCPSIDRDAGQTTFHEQFLAHLWLPVVHSDRMARALNADDAGSVACLTYDGAAARTP